MLIENTSKSAIAYTVEYGLSRDPIFELINQWGTYREFLIREMLEIHPNFLEYSVDQKRQVLQTNNIEDIGWNWGTKALHLNSPEYEWFFLKAAGQIQAVLVLFHPKNSRIDGKKISYIDYLASADWNRTRPGHTPLYRNSARILLREAVKHSTNMLQYRPGFSLHSLPAAENFYKKLGMKDLGFDVEKQNLLYFEAEEIIANNIMAATYV